MNRLRPVEVSGLSSRMDHASVMDLGLVKSKGRKRKKPEAFRVGAIVTSQWGLCSVIARARGGYNCDFGDGKAGGWYVESHHLALA